MMRIIAPLVFLGAAATAVLHFAYPAAAAAGCPSCYGFTDLGDGVYVEGGMAADRRAAAKATVEAARARVSAFYGDLRSSRACCFARPRLATGPSAAARGASPCSTAR